VVIRSCSENPNPDNEVDRAIDAEDKEYNDILRLVCSVDISVFFSFLSGPSTPLMCLQH
jgi:hypothetical protein